MQIISITVELGQIANKAICLTITRNILPNNNLTLGRI